MVVHPFLFMCDIIFCLSTGSVRFPKWLIVHYFEVLQLP
ncbi:conserved hypothetical protein [delta proteobacterium NaphS2]|nr:conserved hypothetical protein [delta proteobacterium NaphS2]